MGAYLDCEDQSLGKTGEKDEANRCFVATNNLLIVNVGLRRFSRSNEVENELFEVALP